MGACSSQQRVEDLFCEGKQAVAERSIFRAKEAFSAAIAAHPAGDLMLRGNEPPRAARASSSASGGAVFPVESTVLNVACEDLDEDEAPLTARGGDPGGRSPQVSPRVMRRSEESNGPMLASLAKRKSVASMCESFSTKDEHVLRSVADALELRLRIGCCYFEAKYWLLAEEQFLVVVSTGKSLARDSTSQLLLDRVMVMWETAHIGLGKVALEDARATNGAEPMHSHLLALALNHCREVKEAEERAGRIIQVTLSQYSTARLTTRQSIGVGRAAGDDEPLTPVLVVGQNHHHGRHRGSNSASDGDDEVRSPRANPFSHQAASHNELRLTTSQEIYPAATVSEARRQHNAASHGGGNHNNSPQHHHRHHHHHTSQQGPVVSDTSMLLDVYELESHVYLEMKLLTKALMAARKAAGIATAVCGVRSSERRRVVMAMKYIKRKAALVAQTASTSAGAATSGPVAFGTAELAVTSSSQFLSQNNTVESTDAS